MLYTYSDTVQSVCTDQNVNLETTKIQTSCVATHTPDTAIVKLNRCGFYKVDVVATAEPSSGNDDVAMVLQVNGIDYPGTKATQTPKGNNGLVNLAISALVQVEPNSPCNTSNVPATLTVSNAGTPANYQVVSVTVTK